MQIDLSPEKAIPIKGFPSQPIFWGWRSCPISPCCLSPQNRVVWRWTRITASQFFVNSATQHVIPRQSMQITVSGGRTGLAPGQNRESASGIDKGSGIFEGSRFSAARLDSGADLERWVPRIAISWGSCELKAIVFFAAKRAGYL